MGGAYTQVGPRAPRSDLHVLILVSRSRVAQRNDAAQPTGGVPDGLRHDSLLRERSRAMAHQRNERAMREMTRRVEWSFAAAAAYFSFFLAFKLLLMTFSDLIDCLSRSAFEVEALEFRLA